MKLKMILTFILVFMLVACNNETTPEVEVNNPPVLQGYSEILMFRNNSVPEWTGLIVAYDLEDGDIIITEEMIDFNEFDVSITGFYDVVYTVPDSMELTSTHTINVEVVDSSQGLYCMVDGNIVTEWYFVDSLILEFLSKIDEVFDSSIDGGSEFVELILGDTIDNLKIENDVEQIVTKIVTTESDKTYLFFMSFKDSKYRLLNQTEIFATAELAIENHASTITVSSITGPLTESEFLSIPYIIDSYDLYSFQDLANDEETPLIGMELYKTSWTHSSGDWEDAYLVYHYGDYYLAWTWL